MGLDVVNLHFDERDLVILRAGLTDSELDRLWECLEAVEQGDEVRCLSTMMEAGINPARVREVVSGKASMQDVLNDPPQKFAIDRSILEAYDSEHRYLDDAVAASAYCAVMTHDLLSGPRAYTNEPRMLRNVQLYVQRRQAERGIRAFLESKGPWRPIYLVTGRPIIPPRHSLGHPNTIYARSRRLMEEAHHRAFFALHDPANVDRRAQTAMNTRLDDVFEREYHDVVKKYAYTEIQAFRPEAQDRAAYQEMFSVEGRGEEDVVTVDVECAISGVLAPYRGRLDLIGVETSVEGTVQPPSGERESQQLAVLYAAVQAGRDAVERILREAREARVPAQTPMPMGVSLSRDVGLERR